jgi:hypothetical protein
MCRVHSYKVNYRQHSVDVGNYIMDKQNVRSKINNNNNNKYEFEILIAVTVFWVATPQNLEKIRSYGGKYSLHLQDGRVSKASSELHGVTIQKAVTN